VNARKTDSVQALWQEIPEPDRLPEPSPLHRQASQTVTGGERVCHISRDEPRAIKPRYCIFYTPWGEITTPGGIVPGLTAFTTVNKAPPRHFFWQKSLPMGKSMR
ncbi:hypothetical protein, partial [Methanoregula sp.]|uniref:hypothetical protein n=1 Tax=Methanoregula sp. TaxID=2052170 RepID=UPI003FD82F7A